MEEKRLFFGLSVEAPWPMSYPKGRLISEEFRHITLAFLGKAKAPDMENFPKPDFTIGPVGVCDQVLFLPEATPRVVTNHISWLVDGEKTAHFQKQILNWLEDLGYHIDKRPFLPHVSIAREPFNQKQWEETFEKIPLMVTGVHLYESTGNLHYPSIWELPLFAAFEEFEHTADIAFFIRGKSYDELYRHGSIAMAFKYPHFLDFLKNEPIQDLHHVVRTLNQMVLECDRERGCPFKAVSYHGKMEEKEGFFHWEMIVDV